MNRFAHLHPCRLAAALIGALLLAAPQAEARDLNANLNTREGQVEAALAALGFATVPAPYNSLLFVERAQQDNLRFRNGQIGAGGTPFGDSQVYVEGYLAFQNYNPEFALGDNDDVTVRWRSAAFTGGLGWSFDLAPGLTLVPTLNASIARIISNSKVPEVNTEDGPVDFIAGNGITAGGYGAALTLDYEYRTEAQEVDLVARYTQLRLVPLGEEEGSGSEADVATTAFLARSRQPIPGWTAFGGPVRSVYEATYAIYTGDHADLLDLPWLARFGTGLEFETRFTSRLSPKRFRVMLRYAFGKDFGGLALGAGISF